MGVVYQRCHNVVHYLQHEDVAVHHGAGLRAVRIQNNGREGVRNNRLLQQFTLNYDCFFPARYAILMSLICEDYAQCRQHCRFFLSLYLHFFILKETWFLLFCLSFLFPLFFLFFYFYFFLFSLFSPFYCSLYTFFRLLSMISYI